MLKQESGSVKQVVYNLFLILIGCVLSAVSINALLIPHGFVSGGIMGMALLVHYIIPSVPFGISYLLMNIPIFIGAYICVGRRFFIYSLAGLGMFFLSVTFVHVNIPLDDKILAALFAGIISGVGIGLILRSQGSSGGADILSVIFLKRFSVRVGATVFALNCIVLVLTAAFRSLEIVLYTLIFLYVNARIINLVLNGLSQRKAMLIISDKWDEIAWDIQQELDRTTTLLHAQRGYTRTETQAIYTVVPFRDIAPVKRIVAANDPRAFVVVQDTVEVMNSRVGNQPHW